MKNTVLKKILSLMLLGFLGNQVLASEEIIVGPRFLYALECRDLNQIRKCFDELPDINAQDEGGYTCLHLAAAFSALDAVGYLVEKGLDPKVKSKDGCTLLHSAVRGRDNCEDRVQVVKYLIAQGLDVNAKTNRGATALHLAVEAGCKEVVEVLLGVKDINKSLVALADAETPLYRKATPSHIAIFVGEPDILELLMQNNVEKQFVEDGDGYTVLRILEDMKHIHEETFTIDDLRAEDANRSLAYMDRHNKDKEKMKQFAKIFDDYCSYAKPADL